MSRRQANSRNVRSDAVPVSGARISLRGVSKGRRNRRPSGHPARVAAGREREARRRSAGGGELAAAARRIVEDAGGVTGPLDAELWASHMLGTMWEQRTDLPLDEYEDYALVYGQPLVEAIARTGAPGTLIALTAIAAVDDGELGGLAHGLVDRSRALEAEPSWLPCVGETTVTSAAVMRDAVFDDGFTVFLEARHATGDTHAVGVYIDNNIGLMATDVLLTDSIGRVSEAVRENPNERGELRLEPIEAADAAAQIRAAMELTEITIDPPVSEDYPALRALAILRADEVPGIPSPSENGEMSVADREALRDEFLSAPEGGGFAADGDEAFTASLAIDFCVDYVDGRPLRWSPALVELFMTGWVPRKVVADADLFAALPSALDAWVRFAGRRRGTPEWAIDATREAILNWREEMTSAVDQPASGGPATRFLAAAQEAGIDVTDQEALTTFMAGWNARSTATRPGLT
jgi:hypothetical protein